VTDGANELSSFLNFNLPKRRVLLHFSMLVRGCAQILLTKQKYGQINNYDNICIVIDGWNPQNNTYNRRCHSQNDTGDIASCELKARFKECYNYFNNVTTFKFFRKDSGNKVNVGYLTVQNRVSNIQKQN